jgi:hypothetical protein
MVQYVKEGTEAFDDPFPAGGRRLASGRAFERMLNPLSTFISMQGFVSEKGDLEGGMDAVTGVERGGCPRG